MKSHDTSRCATAWNYLRGPLGWFWLATCLTAAWLSWHPNMGATVLQKLEANVPAQLSYAPQTSFPVSEVEFSGTPLSEIRFITKESVVSELRKLRTKPIEQIKIGERVAAFNPELSKEGHRAPEPDWTDYKLIVLVAYQDGVRYDVELFRPASWFDETSAKAGGTIHLILEEMGLDAQAVVEAIKPSPLIKKGSGRVVTGTFKHPADNIRNLYVEGLTEPIGVTEYHPFWAESRLVFAQVRDLKPGEKLLSSLGRTHVIQRIEERPNTEMVFNLEVEHEHCFQATDHGIINHNQACTPRKSSATLRNEWEREHNKPWPKDPTAAHILPFLSKDKILPVVSLLISSPVCSPKPKRWV